MHTVERGRSGQMARDKVSIQALGSSVGRSDYVARARGLASRLHQAAEAYVAELR